MTHLKTKHAEYKHKLRRANQNIATLLARIAKFDIQLAAEREGHEAAGEWSPEKAQHRADKVGSFNLHELMERDGLNEEIQKLLAD